jgi:ACS family glucarate transporter-like MFS transporter
LLIFWMFVISAIAFLDRVNIGVAGTSMERAFGFDHVKFGIVASAFNWGYALFQAPGGRLADRFGPRWILAFGTICLALEKRSFIPQAIGWSQAGFRFASGASQMASYSPG